jgi:hypothetical protein
MLRVPINPLPDLTLKALYKKGARKIGVMLGRLYLCDKVTPRSLKGPDRYYYEQFKTSCVNTQIVNIVFWNDMWVIEDAIMPILNMEDSFNTLYYDANDDLYDMYTEYGEPQFSVTPTTDDHSDVSEWSIITSAKFSMIRKSYCLGDAVFLHRPGVYMPEFSPENEIYLGNGGFDGAGINKARALIGYLPQFE